MNRYYAKRKDLTDTENITLGSAAVLAGFLNNKKSYNYIAVYEEMMSDIRTNVTKMFEALDFPQDNLEDCIKALDQHSQNKMFDSIKSETDLITEEDWKRADEILEELDLPFRISMSVEEFIQEVK